MNNKMKDNMGKMLLVIVAVLPIAVLLNYFLLPKYSRLALIPIFFMPFLSASYSKKFSHGKALMFLSFIIIPTIIFATRNVTRFDAFLNGMELSGTRTLARKYIENGNLVFPDAHSYFPQTSLLIYFLSLFCGFSLVNSSIVIIALHILLMGLVGLYAYKIMIKGEERETDWFIPLMAILSVSVSNNLMYTNIAYRYLASPLLLLLLFFMFDRTYRESPQREYNVVTLLLSVGITLGDPTSALLMIPFFILVSLIGGKTMDSVYALIPLSYLTYSATSYIFSIRTYTRFAFIGFIEFLQDVARNQFPERVVPWERTMSLSMEDIYLTSIGYLSLLMLSAVVGLFYVLQWTRNEITEDTAGRNVLAKTTGLALLGMSGIAALTYIGASVRSEVSFSDIRTIAMIFLSSFLTFSFTPKVLKKYLTGKKTLYYLVSILLIFSSLRIIYNAYPKSIHDPIKVVEDGRLGSKGVYVAAYFVNDYYRSGGIVADYKTLNRLGEELPKSQYEKRWLNASTIEYPFSFYPTKSILIFNTAGNKYPSLYHPKEAYQAATNYTLVHNRIYDNGVIVAATEEGR